MRPTLPLCGAALLLSACTIDNNERNGTFVGNPGKLELTAARTNGITPLGGAAVLDELRMVPCDGTAPQAVDLADTRFEVEAFRFTADPPIDVPAGSWCGMELQFSELQLEVFREGYGAQFILAFADIAVAVSGPELVIEGQQLGFELARPEWLAELPVQVEYGADPVDLAEAAPETWASLRDILIGASALVLEAPPGAGQTTDGETPDGQVVGGVIWGGDDRPPEPVTATSSTSTPPTGPLYALFEQGPFAPPEPMYTDDLPSMAVSGQTTAVVYASVSYGPDSLVAFTYGPQGDPTSGDLGVLVHAGARQPHVVANLNGAFDVTSAGGAGEVFIDMIDAYGLMSSTTLTPLGAASYPASTGDGLTAWLEGSTLWISTTDPQLQPVALASGVRGPFDLTSTDGQVSLAWVEDFPNPVTGDSTPWLQVARFDEASSQLMRLDAALADRPEAPRVATGPDTMAVAYRDSSGARAGLFGPTGARLAGLPVPQEALDADVTFVDDLFVVTWAEADGVVVQLFDALDGAPRSEPLFLQSVFGDRVHVAASSDAGVPAVSVLGVSQGSSVTGAIVAVEQAR